MSDKITKSGIYSGISMDAYHGDLCAGPSVSSSGLRTIFLQSPAHYWVSSYLNPARTEQKDSAALTLGRAAHHLLLGEDDFSTLFIARPAEIAGKPWQGNRTECKEWIAAQVKAGRTVLVPDQFEQIRGMARALADHPLVRAGILNGEIEKSLVWKDKETGVWLKARPDAIPNESGDYADLKTTSKVGSELDREVSNRRYDVQAALTGIGAREVIGKEMSSFSFVFVESEPPHSVDVLTLDKADIEAAEKDLRAALRTFAWCHKNSNWFGPSGTQLDARYVHISDWARENAEYRRDFLEREIKKAESASEGDTESTLAAG
jgi:hypothetical protein